VTIISPADNGLVSGLVTIRARASDDRSCPVVDFYVDDALESSDSAGSDSVAACVWDAGGQNPNSQHRLMAKAIDASGNSAESQVVTVTIGIQTGPTYHSGFIGQPETWDPRGNPHVVDGNLTIRSLLTLSPDVEVRVDSGFGILVGNNGGLLAQGTSASPIAVTLSEAWRSHNSTAPARRKWKGIEVAVGAKSDSVILAYCTIAYGGSDTGDANIDVKSGPIVIRYCLIRNGAGYGILTTGNNLKEFAGNTVTGNARAALRIDSRYLGIIAPDNACAGNGAGIEVSGGTVAISAVWYALGADYVIADDLQVGSPSGATLTLSPGVRLRFKPGTGLIVGGQPGTTGELVASGSPGNRTTFTSDSSSPAPGNWQGITFRFTRTSGASSLNNCLIEYAGGNGFGSVFCDSAAISLTGTIVRNSANYGVYVRKAQLAEFTGNNISSCASYPMAIEPDLIACIGAGNTLVGPPNRGVLVLPGSIRQSITWPNHGFPYVVQGDLDIGYLSHPVLTLARGDTIVFLANARLRIGATFNTQRDSGGLAADSVTFTSLTPPPGTWRGIEFLNYTLNAASYLRNSVIKYGGGDTFGNILCRSSAPLIAGNEIAYSAAYGIYLYNSPLSEDTLRANNTFHDNARNDVGP
jgi:parallel beta-helix repeat protein